MYNMMDLVAVFALFVFMLFMLFSALEVFLNDMRYINPRFTYLLTYAFAAVFLCASVFFSE